MSNPSITVKVGGTGTPVGADIDVGLDDIRINYLPHITIDPLDISTHSDAAVTTTSTATIDLGLDKINAKIDLGLNDIRVGLREQRYHWPINLKFGLCVLGVQLFCFDICGENMFIAEDLKHHKSEECA